MLGALVATLGCGSGASNQAGAVPDAPSPDISAADAGKPDQATGQADVAPTPDPAATAMAVASSIQFSQQATIVAGPLPPATPNSGIEVAAAGPLNSFAMIGPGAKGTASLALNYPKVADDPVVALMVQFQATDVHYVVANPDVASSDQVTVSAGFVVSPDICANLCNIVHSVMCYESAMTASGLVTAANLTQIQVDCTAMGSSGACNGPIKPVCSGVDLAADPSNCGACGKACSTAHIAPACHGGLCGGTCAPGYQDCNGTKALDGCETSVSSSVLNCGGCGHVCSALHITAVCTSGLCDGPCDPGYEDCDGDKATGGCEVFTQGADPQNCGGCGKKCAGTCKDGVCQ
ncbi:MAG: hypothetical protein HY902_02845 [Deltaproteobacteria bacterium]|nr:hypothetical protein [Deltaproteobacteria bacterium]